MKTVVLTGDRPTGHLHLGHYVGSLHNRLALQHTHQQYVMIADIQALTDYFEKPQHITQSVYHVMCDYLSVGLDPALTTFFIQSQVPEISELTTYFMNLVTLGRLERNPTVKSEIQQKGYDDSIPAGFFCYPVSQAADITIMEAELVPVGEDQLPMIEQTNEIVRKFNRIYGENTLKECKALVGKAGRLVGIDGKAKASKSLNNAIFLSDSLEDVKQKVMHMFTDPDHLRVSDPGKIQGNVVFSYLDIFYPDQDHLKELKAHYQRGGLGDMVLKNLLYDTLKDFLAPIHARRQMLKPQDVMEKLHVGTKKARLTAQSTMEKVRSAIGLSYEKILA